MADLADYEWLTSSSAADWLVEFASSELPLHRQLDQLRKTLSAERARLVVGLVELRRRAASKFGDLAAKLYFTDIALQQSTDLWTARYKASRLPCDVDVVDYCCGIGGDLLGFAERGPTTGLDRAPEIAHLANANLLAIGAPSTSCVSTGLVEDQIPTPDQVWHLDPDRRPEGRRSTQIQWHSPGPELVERWLSASPSGLLKLAPATVVPEEWADQAECEWISRDRQCRQQVVWFGELATSPGQRRVTSLPKLPTGNIATFVGSADVEAPLTNVVSKYVYDTDPAVRAASLTGALALEQELWALQHGAAYLTSEQPVEHPLLARFTVQDQLPLRVNALSKHLRGLGIGRLEIKKRGVETDPEKLRKQLKLQGDKSATLLLARQGESEIAILASREEG